MTTPVTAPYELPIFLRGVAPHLHASIHAMVNGVESIDYAYIYSLVNFDTLGYDELESFFTFFRIRPLFTRIFTVDIMRSIAKRGDELYRLRGKSKALSLFSNLVNVFYVWEFRFDVAGRIVGIHFTISPPTGVIANADWARYMRDAFKFLLPIRLTVDSFTITLAVTSEIYISGFAFISNDIP